MSDKLTGAIEAGDRNQREFIERLLKNAETTHREMREEYRTGFVGLNSEINGERDGKGIKGRLRDLEGATAIAHTVQLAISGALGWFASTKH